MGESREHTVVDREDWEVSFPDSAWRGFGLPDRWPAPGDLVGTYVVEGLLGDRAGSRLYRARDRSTGGRPVLVKVWHPELDYAQCVVDHPGVARIENRDPAVWQGLSVDAMSMVGHVTLADVIAARAGVGEPGEIPPQLLGRGGSYRNAVVEIGTRAAAALQHAHARGVWHGDLRPDRILVDHAGRSTLYDFAGDRPSNPTGFGYVSPEWLRVRLGESAVGNADPAEGDVYALGVILYQLLVGSLPFRDTGVGLSEEDSCRSLLALRSAGCPSALRSVPGIEPALVEVVERSLTSDRRRRFPTAGELERALRRIPVQRSRRRVMVAAGGLVLAMVALAFGSGLYRKPATVTLGWELFEQGAHGEAADVFDRRLAEAPRDEAARRGRGLALLAGGDAERALADLARLSHPDRRTNRAHAYCLAKARNDWDAAERFYRQLHAAGDDSFATRNNRGCCLLNLQRYSEATIELEAAASGGGIVTAFNRALLERAVAGAEGRLPETRDIRAVAARCSAWNVQLAAAMQLATVAQGSHADRASHVALALHHAERAVEAGCPGRRLEILATLLPEVADDPRYAAIVSRPGDPGARTLETLILPELSSEVDR